MPREAHKQATQDTVDTAGLEDFFRCHDKTSQQDLTLEEASARLNLSERTIQRRLKQGQLRGYKIPGPRGPEWRIQVETTDNSTVDTTQATVDTTPTGLVTTVINPMSSQDKTQDEQAVASPISDILEFYKEQIDVLHDKLEAATYRNGYLEAQLSAAQQEVKLLPDLSARATMVEQLEEKVAKLESELSAERQRSGWSRFCSWFFARSRV